MTEPDAGTDVADYRTAVEVRGDRLILNGAKTLISRADEAAAFVVFARIDGRPGREGIGCGLLEARRLGFSVVARYHTMGGELRKSGSRSANCRWRTWRSGRTGFASC
jgi:alkylation response protein AidB-like acyl-CoA dehydrogenase